MSASVRSCEWSETPLRHVLAVLETGSRPRGGVRDISQGILSIGGEHLDPNGGFRLERPRYVPEEFADAMKRGHVRVGDTLIVKDGATTGKTSLVRSNFPYQKAVVNEHVFICRPIEGVVPEYLFYFLFSSKGNRQIMKSFRGTAQGGIPLAFADGVEVPLAPYSEQQRIVTFIEEQLSRLGAAVAGFDQVQKKLITMRACLFNLTSPPLTARNDLVSIDATIRVVDYRGRTPPFSESGIPHLRTFNIRDGQVKWDGCAWVSQETYDKYMSRGFPSPGDLLFTTEAPMGEVAFAPEERFCMAQRMMLLKPDPDIWLPEYLMYHLRSPWFQSRLRLKATGTTVQGISSRNFRPMQLYAPPLEEQASIAERVHGGLESIHRIERELLTLGARASLLGRSILAAAFSGEVVTSGDPAKVPLTKAALP